VKDLQIEIMQSSADIYLGGYSLSYNTQLFIEEYYPDVNPGLWLAMCSIVGGSFGVFFGGW